MESRTGIEEAWQDEDELAIVASSAEDLQGMSDWVEIG